MTLNIKTPIRVDHWTASDNKIFNSEEKARGHEVFLAVNPLLPKGPDSRYSVICELARLFDFVPRSPASPPPDHQGALPEKTGLRCSYCDSPQFVTRSGLTCKNGHGGAPSL